MSSTEQQRSEIFKKSLFPAALSYGNGPTLERSAEKSGFAKVTQRAGSKNGPLSPDSLFWVPPTAPLPSGSPLQALRAEFKPQRCSLGSLRLINDPL